MQPALLAAMVASHGCWLQAASSAGCSSSPCQALYKKKRKREEERKKGRKEKERKEKEKKKNRKKEKFKT